MQKAREKSRPCLQMSHEGREEKKPTKKTGYYFLNKLDCLLRHLFQMTRNMKMSRGTERVWGENVLAGDE